MSIHNSSIFRLAATVSTHARVYSMLSCVVLVTACSGDSTGPSNDYPRIAGSYAGSYGVTFSNTAEQLSETVAITVTLQNPNSQGAFSGSYIIAGGGGSGALAGTVRTDGGISLTQFGDPNASASENFAYLQSVFYWCNVAALASSGTTGSVIGSQLTITTSASMPCAYTNPSTVYQTTITVRISASR